MAHPEKSPLVSIVTPSFNQGHYLEATVRSVLDQSYPNLEYLVMDGGSRDSSVEVLRRYSDRLAHWQSAPDKGFGDAIANGFARARGEILAYLNSDDLIAPDAVARAVAALNARPDAVMVYGHRACIDPEGRLLYYRPSPPWLANSAYCSLIVPQETCYWRRSVYEAAGGMNRNLRFAIDYDLFSRFARQGRFLRVPGIWGFFRKHAESKTMTSYQDVGMAEGFQVQRDVWGGEVPMWRWRIVQNLMRAYALLASLRTAPDAWPTALPTPEPIPWRRRVVASLHETSRLKSFLRRLGWER